MVDLLNLNAKLMIYFEQAMKFVVNFSDVLFTAKYKKTIDKVGF